MSRAARRAREPAAELPVAQVCVDLPLPHLDRPFDYLVPQADAEAAQPGVRVRVRFAGQLVDGWLLARCPASEHPGKLAYLERVVSPVSVLRPEVLELTRAVAARYAGNLADVLRLAVPPRHARVESAAPPAVPAPPPSAPGASIMEFSEDPPSTAMIDAARAGASGGWGEYRAGGALLRRLAQGGSARAVWNALPGEEWPTRLAEAAAATVSSGRGVVMVVPDARDLDRLAAAMAETLAEPGRCVTLAAALGPAERYRRFLQAVRGEATVVIGNRAAALAPVSALGLVAIWDDGDDLHAEPRAPYPHTREVLLTRAQLAGAGALIAGFARTAEAQQLLATGWAQPVTADRARVRARAPVVTPIGDEPQLARDPAATAARLPSEAWQAAHRALRAGAPVLVQVPRRGYLPVVACAQCRTPARCGHCAGPLQLAAAQAIASCRWCARPAVDHQCGQCGQRRLRAAVTGARRTAEELGRAFAGVPVRTSGRDEVLATVAAEPAVVVATPGAEPLAIGGYGAVLLLDTWALLTRADLRAGEEALRRWLAAAALARPGPAGGRVVVVADGGVPAVQALLRFDPGWYAERECVERRELGFPPAARVASLTGSATAIEELLAVADLPDGAELLGPVPVPGDRGGPDRERMLVRVARTDGLALAAGLHAAAGVRSARKGLEPVRIQVDPLELL